MSLYNLYFPKYNLEMNNHKRTKEIKKKKYWRNLSPASMSINIPWTQNTIIQIPWKPPIFLQKFILTNSWELRTGLELLI